MTAGRALLGLLALPLAVAAAPFVPKDDAEIVQRLPYRADAAERARRTALARDPAQLPLAEASARAARADALLRAFEASGKDINTFAGMYGLHVLEANRSLERARARQAPRT